MPCQSKEKDVAKAVIVDRTDDPAHESRYRRPDPHAGSSLLLLRRS
jgi:hypothetical protein